MDFTQQHFPKEAPIINEYGVEMWGEGVEVFEGEIPVF
jgi:hypothetical protein